MQPSARSRALAYDRQRRSLQSHHASRRGISTGARRRTTTNPSRYGTRKFTGSYGPAPPIPSRSFSRGSLSKYRNGPRRKNIAFTISFGNGNSNLSKTQQKRKGQVLSRLAKSASAYSTSKAKQYIASRRANNQNTR